MKVFVQVLGQPNVEAARWARWLAEQLSDCDPGGRPHAEITEAMQLTEAGAAEMVAPARAALEDTEAYQEWWPDVTRKLEQGVITEAHARCRHVRVLLRQRFGYKGVPYWTLSAWLEQGTLKTRF